ncbi:hypothetical protein AX14_013939 [Amanita brunnescens Koide BX004]|nr:hypothetical protein AX14_013939 [Amanita brunnescens Koide BX004]
MKLPRSILTSNGARTSSRREDSGALKAMKKTYSLAKSADELTKYPYLQDAVVRMLKKTIVCVFHSGICTTRA